jgi:hypothetical protein
VGLEIDVKPVCPALASYGDSSDNELCCDALPPIVGMHAGVKDEGMNTAIPRNVHETYQTCPVVGANMSEAAG